MPKKSLSCVENMYVAMPAVKPVTTGRGTNLTALRWDGQRKEVNGGGCRVQRKLRSEGASGPPPVPKGPVCETCNFNFASLPPTHLSTIHTPSQTRGSHGHQNAAGHAGADDQILHTQRVEGKKVSTWQRRAPAAGCPAVGRMGVPAAGCPAHPAPALAAGCRMPRPSRPHRAECLASHLGSIFVRDAHHDGDEGRGGPPDYYLGAPQH